MGKSWNATLNGFDSMMTPLPSSFKKWSPFSAAQSVSFFFSSWTLFKLTGRTWQNVFILSSLARKVLGHDNFSHGFLIEESHQSWELTHETLRGGKFFPPKLMPAVIDTLVEISFVNKPGGRWRLTLDDFDRKALMMRLHFLPWFVNPKKSRGGWNKPSKIKLGSFGTTLRQNYKT